MSVEINPRYWLKELGAIETKDRAGRDVLALGPQHDGVYAIQYEWRNCGHYWYLFGHLTARTLTRADVEQILLAITGAKP
jgi:hypothetical protein